MIASPLTAILAIAPSAFCGEGESEATHVPRSLRELRMEVERWGEEHFSSFNAADIDAIADWLDTNFYRLSR